ncbi:endoplasmic reticulum-Golgi intermediate compartment protein 3-like [Gymnogyps californianus]|uniref:endoplasmic reticulum-Golgi intermediate compartment protein 3-like n=1 Tax=Gymnogyps californianus TaxID=33616 RepID=UPI0021C97589|nr:endoplasmic reticulum-Golgi intermediate compartment protein 3-like [Gymnogyps californianus]XP_050770561.1 endoplasmic reticulum-Golgi intermediate compartment protein 3-like [Gymnogyps californianus]
MASLWRLKRFDAFPKPLEDFRVKTCGGALVTAVSGLIVVLLFFSELQYYLPKEVQYPSQCTDWVCFRQHSNKAFMQVTSDGRSRKAYR